MFGGVLICFSGSLLSNFRVKRSSKNHGKSPSDLLIYYKNPFLEPNKPGVKNSRIDSGKHAEQFQLKLMICSGSLR